MSDRPLGLKMFCPKCGKAGGGICFECLLEENPLRVGKPVIEFCGCGRVRFRQKWVEDLIELLPAITARVITLPAGVRLQEVSVVPQPRKKTLMWEAVLTLEYDGRAHHVAVACHADLRRIKCPSCTKTSARYFEAVLQVRGERQSLVPSEREVSDVERSRGGVDYYIKSVSYARKITKQYKKLGYSVSESEKLFGQREGKEVYRVSFSVKPPSYSIGDVLALADGVYQILTTGANARIIDVRSHKERTIPRQMLEGVKVIAKKHELRDALVTAVTPHETQVIEAATGRPFEIKGSGTFKPGDEVHLLLHHGRPFILGK